MENRGKSILRTGSGRGRGRNTNPQFRQPGYRPQAPPPEYYYQTQQSSYPPEYHYHTQQSSYPPEYPYHTQQDMNEGFEAFQPDTYRDRQEETDDDDDDDDSVPETEEEQEDEEVEETQPIPSRGKGKRGGESRGKRGAESSGPMAPKPWTPQEEVALAQSYLSISEDGNVGNAQRRKKFWERILQDFSQRLGGSDRTTHQLNSKWRDLNGRVSLFCGLYNNNWNNRGSGQSEVDVMNVTHEQYRAAKKKAFTSLLVWDTVKGHPRWAPIPLAELIQPPTSGPAPKRTKTSESNTYTTTSSDANFTPSEEMHEPERPQRKGKKPVSVSKDDPFWDEFKAFQQKTTIDVEDKIRHRAAVEEIKKEKLRVLQQNEEKRLRILEERERRFKQEKDEEFFLRPHDHLKGSAYQMVIQKKRKIAAEYGWEFDV